MIQSELFKITRHRTPWVIAAVYTVMVLIAPMYFLIKPPDDAGAYLETATAVFGVAGLLLAPVFGAWVVGNEYRHGTLRRVLAIDARRGRLLGTKTVLGLSTMVAGLAAVAGVSFVASVGVAAIHGDSLVTDGVLRTFLGGAFIAVVTGALAFALSIILRSDTYAMLGALAAMIVVGPLASLIPTVGSYTPAAVTGQIAERIEDSAASGDLSLITAVAVLVATLAALAAGSTQLFATRDV